MLSYLQCLVGLLHEPLGRGPGGEVAGPVGVRVAGVGEEVVRLGGKGEPGLLVHGLQVAGGRGVEQVDLAPLAGLEGVDVGDQLVQVLVPGAGLLVVEVHAHGHGQVGVGPVGRGPGLHLLQKGSGAFVNIVSLH